MVKPGAKRTSADGRGGGGGSSSGTEKDAAGVAPRKMRLRRRPALGDISSAVGNKAGASADAAAARKTVSAFRKTLLVFSWSHKRLSGSLGGNAVGLDSACTCGTRPVSGFELVSFPISNRIFISNTYFISH